jgi:hypothetical protein
MSQLTAKEMSQGGSADTRRFKNEAYATLTHASPELIKIYKAEDLRLRTYLVRDLFHEPDYSSATTTLTTGKYRAYGKLRISDEGQGVPPGSHFLPVDDARTYGQALRFTEAYLIFAEAQALRGYTDDAINALKEIWKNRSIDRTLTYTSGDIVALVREERRRELCFEALRWFDLRRQGMPPFKHVWYAERDEPQESRLEQNDPGYTFPMPENIMLTNPDLTQVPKRN